MFIREMNNLCVMKVDYINTYYIIEVMNYDIYIYIYIYMHIIYLYQITFLIIKKVFYFI